MITLMPFWCKVVRLSVCVCDCSIHLKLDVHILFSELGVNPIKRCLS